MYYIYIYIGYTRACVYTMISAITNELRPKRKYRIVLKIIVRSRRRRPSRPRGGGRTDGARCGGIDRRRCPNTPHRIYTRDAHIPRKAVAPKYIGGGATSWSS